jgi:hypothetical protein
VPHSLQTPWHVTFTSNH